MQATAVGSSSRISSDFNMPIINGRPDFEFSAALQKVSPQAQARAKSTATDFEAMFLNSMFSEMTAGLKGEGPFGETQGTGVWRSMLTEQYSKSFASAGGVGIATEVYRTLILQQAKTQQGNAQQGYTQQTKTQQAKTLQAKTNS
jgi:Rod binding domain-containing protein